MRFGDVIRIGKGEFVVLDTGEDTDRMLVRNIKTGKCLYLDPTAEYEVIEHGEIVFMSDVEKKFKVRRNQIRDTLYRLLNLLEKTENEYHEIVTKMKDVAETYEEEYLR